ncbi:MAG: DUF1801 domain-containing protein [Flavobacteriales bacterium]|nr:DUF1801 domain-containing protein [Flavobacteriales bacterium]
MSVGVDHYLLDLPFPQQFIAQELRRIILNSSTKMEESIKYGVPFYTYKKPFCYLAKKKTGIMYVGLIHGQKIKNHSELLISEKLKQVSHLEADSIDFVEENQNEITAIIQEAILLNL